MLSEMQERDVLTQSEMADTGIRLHDEPVRKNPGEADSAGRMNAVTKLLL
jgi:hypothetical protein